MTSLDGSSDFDFFDGLEGESSGGDGQQAVTDDGGFDFDEQATPAAETTETVTKEATALPPELFKGIPDDVAELMRAAAETGEYDLKNPALFKAVRQIAEKEKLIREGKKAEPLSPDASDYLKAFMDPEPESTTAQETAPTDAPKIPDYIELANSWKDPTNDAYAALSEAYSMDTEGPEKAGKVIATHKALIDRHVHEEFMPAVANFIQRTLEAHLGPVMQDVQERQQEQIRFDVVQKMAQDPRFEGIMGLFEPTGQGVIEHAGQKFEDRMINRIFAEHPELLDITVKGKNEQESQRLTIAKRFAAAHRLMKTMQAQRPGKTDSTTVKSAVKTGMAIANSKRDADRSGLNSGKPGVPSTGSSELDQFIGAPSSGGLESLFK